MAINVIVQYNGGLLPDIILLAQYYYHKGHEEVMSLQPIIPPKRFDIFPPDWGMLRRSRCVQIFLLRHFFANIYNFPFQTSKMFFERGKRVLIFLLDRLSYIFSTCPLAYQ